MKKITFDLQLFYHASYNLLYFKMVYYLLLIFIGIILYLTEYLLKKQTFKKKYKSTTF